MTCYPPSVTLLVNGRKQALNNVRPPHFHTSISSVWDLWPHFCSCYSWWVPILNPDSSVRHCPLMSPPYSAPIPQIQFHHGLSSGEHLSLFSWECSFCQLLRSWLSTGISLFSRHSLRIVFSFPFGITKIGRCSVYWKKEALDTLPVRLYCKLISILTSSKSSPIKEGLFTDELKA